jgi:NDP-sugar pyrophosphorylase family protein
MKQAIILAGGKGERLRPYTDDRPKPMVPLMGSPLLQHTIKWMISHGLRRITICCGYLHQVIIDYFGNGSKFGINIEYLVEEKPLGRGGALRRAMKSLPPSDEPVLAMNGDIFTNLNLSDLLAFHKAHGGPVTLVSVPLVSPYGIVDMNENGSVKGFREKPELPFWINAGIYLFEPSMTDLLPQVGDHETSTFPQLAAEGRLKSYQSRAFWRAVDNSKDLTQLRADCEELFFGTFMSSATFSAALK